MEKMDYVRSVNQRINAMMSVSLRSLSSFSREDFIHFDDEKEAESFLAGPEGEMESECSNNSYLPVPPTTPAPMFSFENLKSVTKATIVPKLESCEIPYVRQVGIKGCIERLSKHFNFEDYRLNPVQFWFLDVITDCLWQLQDEYQFPEIYQKTVLQWVIFCINLIIDPLRNFSRKQFFQVFNEALVAAKEHVQAGCDVLPPPEDLFDLRDSEDEEEISFPSDKSSSFVQPTEHTGSESYLAVGLDENTEIFKLPKRPSIYYRHVESPKTVCEETVCVEGTTSNGSEESVLFYQPDPNIPERFLSSSSSSFVSEPGEDDDIPIWDEKFFWKKSSPKDLKKSCSNDTSVKQQETGDKDSETFDETEKNDIKKEWTTYLEDREEYLNELDKKILINTCLISAIRKFIYDYFYETFQYSIVQLGLINAFTSIRQSVNKKWNVPKVIKEELKPPKPKKEKKKKKDKIKKKTKAKKDKKKPKKDKAKKKSKKEKKPKKERKPTKKKLTKEEKAELDRQKKKQKELEDQWLREEENRRLLFPLKDAINDDFFREIFDHWTKPKEKKSRGKGKKK